MERISGVTHRLYFLTELSLKDISKMIIEMFSVRRASVLVMRHLKKIDFGENPVPECLCLYEIHRRYLL